MQDRRPVGPIRLELHPTDTCNHSCIWCVALPERKKAAQIPGQRLIPLLDELADAGVMEVLFSGGGDPLTHPDVGACIARAARRGLEVEVITNGGAITDSVVASMVSHCGTVRVSLDAGTSHVHSLIHRPSAAVADTYQVIVDHLAKLVTLRGGHVRPRIIASFVLHPLSINSLEHFLETCAHVGVDGADIKYNFFSAAAEASQLHQTATRIVDAFATTHPGFKTSYDAFVERSRPISAQDGAAIQWPYLYVSASIDAAGNVYPCCHLTGRPDFLEGNILHQSFEEMWYSEDRQTRLAEIVAHGEQCRICPHKTPNRMLVQVLSSLEKCRPAQA